MPLVSFKKVSKYFGAQDLLIEADWTIEEGHKYGLIGPNGTGKTTIFRMIMGEEKTTEGNISKQGGLTVGLLAQSAQAEEGVTLWQSMLSARPELPSLQAEMTKAEHDMADPQITGDEKKLQKIMDQYADMQARFAAMDGYGFDAKIREVLTGMRFVEAEYDRPLSSFSGGERTRLALARLLIEDPQLLLLDEPTNHLDTATAEWLEAYLREFKGTLVAISHDRWFLNHVVTEITELTRNRLQTYTGNYEKYKILKEEELKANLRAYTEQKTFIEKEEAYVRKNIAGRQSRGASGRRTKLARLERIENPVEKVKKISLKFNVKGQSGKEVARFSAVTKGFDDRVLFKPFEGTLYRGDRIGLIGPNGAGKSTLLKVLCARLEADGGVTTIGSSVYMGYYDQMQDDLSPDKTVLDCIWDLIPGEGHQVARGIAGRFLFGEGDVEKKVKSLSGGEKARVILARLMMQGPNFLVMDEPTNHLDIASREVVEGALDEFEGSLLAVSHDRYFLDREANQIWEIENGEIHIFKGNYSEYLREKERGGKGHTATVAGAEAKPAQVSSSRRPVESSADSDEEKRRRIEERENARREEKNTERRMKELQSRMNEIQKEIEKLESQKVSIEDEFLDPALVKEPERMKELRDRQKVNADSLDARYFKWQELEDRLKAVTIKGEA